MLILCISFVTLDGWRAFWRANQSNGMQCSIESNRRVACLCLFVYLFVWIFFSLFLFSTVLYLHNTNRMQATLLGQMCQLITYVSKLQTTTSIMHEVKQIYDCFALIFVFLQLLLLFNICFFFFAWCSSLLLLCVRITVGDFVLFFFFHRFEWSANNCCFRRVRYINRFGAAIVCVCVCMWMSIMWSYCYQIEANMFC